MDIEFFLNERLDFATHFYEESSKPFLQTISAIEEGKQPFDSPPYDESGEPPFLKEWMRADTALQSLGLAALSMTASALQLYLNEWISRCERGRAKVSRKGKGGWFNVFLRRLNEFGVRFDLCPVETGLFEQMVLARNRGQHSEHISSIDIFHSESDMDKYPSPYFVSELDRRVIELDDSDRSWWLSPKVHIDSRKLAHLTHEISKFGTWLEEEFLELERARVHKKGWRV